MGEIPLEDLLPKANGSVYKLVRMAANRALEIAEGKPSLIDAKSIEKISTIVLNEINQGKVVSKNYKGDATDSDKATQKKADSK